MCRYHIVDGRLCGETDVAQRHCSGEHWDWGRMTTSYSAIIPSATRLGELTTMFRFSSSGSFNSP